MESRDKKKVLFIHSSAELYGSDRSLLNLISALDKSRFEIHVILPMEGPLVEALERVPDVSINLHEMAVLRRKNLSVHGMMAYFAEFHSSYRYLKKYIREHAIDIVYTNTSVVFPGAVAAKRMHKKSVWHIREIMDNRFENALFSSVIKRYSDAIIANSHITGDSIAPGSKKVHVVYNAVKNVTDREYPPENHSGIFLIGMAGRINRRKGQKLFVDAAEIICREFENVRFQIAGNAYEGQEHFEEELKKYIKEKGLTEKIELLGLVTDMNQFYSSLDVFVMPSTMPESFGLVILEAMEWAVPVISTNHGGPVEIIHDGEDGFLVSVTDPQEMADRILQLIKDEELRSKIGRAGRVRKRAAFSIESTAKGIEDVLLHL